MPWCLLVSTYAETAQTTSGPMESLPHQIDFVLALVGSVGSHQAEQRIFGRLRHRLGREARRGSWRRHLVCEVLHSGDGGGFCIWRQCGGASGHFFFFFTSPVS